MDIEGNLHAYFLFVNVYSITSLPAVSSTRLVRSLFVSPFRCAERIGNNNGKNAAIKNVQTDRFIKKPSIEFS